MHYAAAHAAAASCADIAAFAASPPLSPYAISLLLPCCCYAR